MDIFVAHIWCLIRNWKGYRLPSNQNSHQGAPTQKGKSNEFPI